jgi:hypothetical protein
MNNWCDRHLIPRGGIAKIDLKIVGVMECKIRVCQLWKGFREKFPHEPHELKRMLTSVLLDVEYKRLVYVRRQEQRRADSCS